jgi:hypothetical protein
MSSYDIHESKNSVPETSLLKENTLRIIRNILQPLQHFIVKMQDNKLIVGAILQEAVSNTQCKLEMSAIFRARHYDPHTVRAYGILVHHNKYSGRSQSVESDP